MELPHRAQPSTIGHVDIEFELICDDGAPREEFQLTFALDESHRGSDWGWRAIERVLISVAPPVQDWDRYQDTYFVMSEVGHLDRQRARIAAASRRSELMSPEYGSVGHYVHTRHIAEATVQGNSVRAMCGVVFVPTRDPDQLPVCEHCAAQRAALPR